ncbi:MAG TPA: transporter associated domain-containing protein, partial [Candidatus Krumholzibacteria bacterium]|nr:transporter associated domain-containing protein [Candidatus Krumholzibacteria bacterium]
VSAQMEIDVFNALLGANLDDADVETLGGLVSKRLGRIPRVGEWVEDGDMRFTVEQAAPNRVVRLRLGKHRHSHAQPGNGSRRR